MITFIIIVANLAIMWWSIRRIAKSQFRLGVLNGHMATVYPGDQKYREARELLDKFEAEVLARQMSIPAPREPSQPWEDD